MASTFSTNLGFQLPTTNEQVGVWGNSTNLNFGKLIEQAIAGATVLDLTSVGGTYTFNDLDGSVDESRSAILRFIGTPGVTTTITVPTKPKVYVIRNDSDAIVEVQTAGQVTPIQVGLDEANIFYCDGVDVVKGIEDIVDPILAVSGGGTGVGTFTAGIVKSPGGTTPLITEPTIGLNTFEVGNVLPVTNGGTGVLLFPAGAIAYGTGGTDWAALVGTAVGQYIVSDGTNWAAGTTAIGGVDSFNGRTGAVTPQSSDYSSFYVLQNGSNASGTWNIDISGSAATVSYASSVSSISNSSSNAYGTRTVSTSTPSSSSSGNIWYKY